MRRILGGSSNNGSKDSKKSKRDRDRARQALTDADSKDFASDREDKNLSLSIILKREYEHQAMIREAPEYIEDDIPLHFEPQEKVNQIPEDYSIFLQRN
jgi:hypothetical protein